MEQDPPVKRQRVQVVHPNQEVKGWFLTYPKCDLTPAQALVLLQNLDVPATITEYVIAQEPHKDGHPHLHAFVKYDTKVSRTRDGRRWDLAGHHGHYLPSHSWHKCKEYCKKGGNYIASFDIEAALNKKAKLNHKLIADDPCDLVDSGEISVYQLKALVQARSIYWSLKAPVKPRAQDLVPNPFGLILPVYTTKIKDRHWWFWSSEANTGKTTFLRFLDQRYPCHWMAREKYQSIHSGTQFVLLDEYTFPWLTLFELNQMCDGTQMYPSKGGSPVGLQDPIIVVCSNKPPEAIYPNFAHLLRARFRVFPLTRVYQVPN